MYSAEYDITSHTVDLEILIDQCDEETTIPDPASIAFSKDGNTLFLYFVDDLTIEQKQTLDLIISAHDPILVALKKQRVKEIDDRTTELVDEGFEFAGIIFNGSPESQSRIMAAYMAKDFATYPIIWMSKDDTTYLEITDETMLTSFFLTGFGTLKYKIDLGSTLKINIQNATTVEDVNNIIDPR